MVVNFKRIRTARMSRWVGVFACTIATLPLFHFALGTIDLREAVQVYTGKSANELMAAKACSQAVAQAFPHIWNRKKNAHAQYVRERNAKNSKINFTNVARKNAYDYFEPEWTCEDEVRLGKGVVSSGDGPKFVCGSDVLASTKECIVYSIGSNYDFSFEYAVNKIAPQCEIHTFDGTLNLTKRALPEGLKEKNIHFHNWNIVSDCRSEELAKLNSPSHCVFDSLQKLNHHESTMINWLKIDCEGCEFTVIPKFTGSSVKIDQIMIEVHGTNALRIESLFSSLHNAGMMIFHKERNHWGCDGYRCVEYSLISSSYAQKVLHTFLNTKDRWMFDLHKLSTS
uniref:Methyltransferase domain-containing protein n=1 Tax=Ostreococcus mediterraneus TaxID=1486918 RepID=A0A7S0KEF8_9CHLO|mmetsp:Transcript_2870/g.10375  ORF Transcript_2870/g.10375 Transcript_2870/m.10375 type:complete len:340 (+) Transcript_2870:231-1250(+)